MPNGHCRGFNPLLWDTEGLQTKTMKETSSWVGMDLDNV